MSRDFLVELGTEELPPKALRTLERAFADGVVARLKELALRHGAVSSFAYMFSPWADNLGGK